MRKELIILLLSVILPLGIKAQRAVGSWEVYANYLSPEQMLETSDKVFCLSSGSLFSFDKTTEELYQYGIENVLSEAMISNIFYNGKEDYIAVAYKSANIDIILNDGNVINLPDIKDAVLQSEQIINDISFGDGRMYVATNFGIVIYDTKKWEVKESGIYNKSVKYVAATNAYIGAYFTDDKMIGFMPIDKSVRYYDNFILNSCNACTGLRGLKDNVFLGSNSASSFSPKKVEFDAATNKVAFNKYVPDGNYTGPIECKNGYYIYNTVASGSNVACIKEFDENYNVTQTMLPSEFSGKKIAMWENSKNLFTADNNGISECQLSDDGGITILRESFKPESITCSGVGYLTASNSGKIYISSSGYSMANDGDWPDRKTVSYINVIENNTLKDITPSDLTLQYPNENGFDGTKRASNTYNIVEDPDDPSIYYLVTLYDGVFKIKDGKELNYYNSTNSPLAKTWIYYMTHAIDFDAKGNLWVAGNYNLYCLPSEKRKSTTPTTAEDWVTGFPKGEKNWDASLLACKRSNIVMYSFVYSGQLICVDTKGTVSTTDDSSYIWTTFLDQDGKELSLSNNNIYCYLEDANGQVWVGTDLGVFIIPNPSKLTDPSMRIQRIKVPRNDGTNFADYLLEGEPIHSLAIDGLNRKWIGTANTGAYLVSENGSQILEQFNTENSYLPVNKVYSIACDKYSNAVYFGTVAGLVKYNSDASPSAEDYSEVYAYPNPVRPEYTGFITITGLMENSLIKIADAAGNVFFQGTSNGGMITWDGCDAAGNRVKTGVYYVFASQNENGSSSGAVTKILVVK